MPPDRRLRVSMATARAFPDLGGIESHVNEVAVRVAESLGRVEVMTTDRTGLLPRCETLAGRVSIRRHRALPRRRDYYFSPGLFRDVVAGDYDLLHVQGIHTLVPPLAMLAAALRRKPYLLTFHSGGSSSSFRSRMRRTQFRLMGPLLRRADALVAVSEYERARFEEILDLPAGTIRVIRNGGAENLLADAPVARDLDLVISVGRLERYKGHHRLIEAMPALLQARPGMRALVLGHGPYEAELRTLATELGVSDRVDFDFIEPTDRAGMSARVRGAGVMVLLSDYEAHPVAAMEALSAGTPVVLLKTSGLSELVSAGWARGVAADASSQQIADAIMRQLADPCLPEISDLPTWQSCTDALLDLYQQVLAKSATEPFVAVHA
jgi:glycosyltransferase involved in cell wall biosynthesis